MPRKVEVGAGMMRRETLQYKVAPGPDQAFEVFALFDHLGRMKSPDEARQNFAAEMRGLIEESGARPGDLDLASRFGDASAVAIAAEWLRAFDIVSACRETLIDDRSDKNAIVLLVGAAEQMGRLAERLFWRCGIDEASRKSRERLALRGRDQVAAGRRGNEIKGAKSFRAKHGRAAQARADEIAAENQSWTWARIREHVAKEFDVSAETVKKSIRNPKKDG